MCVLIIDPVISACVGTVWCASRVAYAVGYTRRDRDDGSGRRPGARVFFVMEMALMGMAGVSSYQMIMG